MLACMTGSSEAELGGPSEVHVLVVDDDAGLRQLFRDVLELAGARVTIASSARAALAAIESEMPDVLVSDIMMPEHDGYWLIRAVRQLPPERGGRVRALAITGDPGKNSHDRALAEGYDAHLAKPINVHDLSMTVGRLAAGA